MFLIQTCCGGGNAERENRSFHVGDGRWERRNGVSRGGHIFLEGAVRGVLGAIAIPVSIFSYHLAL